MADAETTKKYYWLKLKRDFFKRHDIRIVEEMPNGKDYVLFYLKMLVESIDHGGELRFSETIPYNEQMLSVITNTNIDIVRSAMKLFIELKMIDLLDDQTIYMSEVQKLIGNETAVAERVRKHRAGMEEQKRLLQCNTDETKCNTEIELYIETDTKLDSAKAQRSKTKKQTFIPPTVDEVKAYCLERKNNLDAEAFVAYYDTRGWMLKTGKMNNWHSAIVTWEKNGFSNGAKKEPVRVYKEEDPW